MDTRRRRVGAFLFSYENPLFRLLWHHSGFGNPFSVARSLGVTEHNARVRAGYIGGVDLLSIFQCLPVITEEIDG